MSLAAEPFADCRSWLSVAALHSILGQRIETDHSPFRSDPDYFASLVDSAAAPNTKALADNWILRFNHLKKLYRLIVRYFECVLGGSSSAVTTREAQTDVLVSDTTTHRDVLRSSTADLLTPNLRLVAKNDPRESDDEVCKLTGLVLALAVQVSAAASSSDANRSSETRADR